jgi:hypothetical protein
MADFGFVGASYEAPSIYQDAQECINFRPEADPTKAPGSRGVVALYPTPGLTTVFQFPNQAEVRGMRTVSGGKYMVAVCGQYVYVVDSDFVPYVIGVINTITGPVSISDNGLYVYIVDGINRYSWKISQPDAAAFVGSISGLTLTVTSVSEGSLKIGQAIYGFGITIPTVITALGTGTGGAGTYTINNAFTIGSQSFNANEAGFVATGSISGTTLSISAITGSVSAGQTIIGGAIVGNTIVTALGEGTVLSTTIATAGTGYAVNDIIYVFGGTYESSPTYYTVATVGSGGTVTGLTLDFPGDYTVVPSNNVSTATNGQGSGLTLTLSFGTGTGGIGNYVVNNTQTVSSTTIYGLNFTVLPSTDGAFEGGGVVDIVDNYFVYSRPDSQQWAASQLLSPITYGLSFASKFTGPDNLVSLICDHGQVYLLGEQTSEVWSDVGTFPFAFQRIPGSASQHGIAAKFSVARLGNSFAYLSRNNRGLSEIVMMNGYFPQRISTHAVENTLVNQYVADAVAYTYQLEGHEVYVISFPSLDITWAYDVTTAMWHKWLWVDSNNVYHRHRSNCSAVFGDKVYVGDWQNGNLYQVDPDVYTDFGGEIRRLRRCPHLVTDLQRQYFEELQIQFQPGVGLNDGQGFNPQAMLRWSSDGGSTWSNEHWTGIGKMGKYNNRAIWRRLGWSRDRIFEVVVTDPVKAVIISANLKASVGEN